MTSPRGIDLLASRIRFEEKRILETLQRRRVPYQVHDTRALVLPLDQNDRSWGIVLNRELALTRARHVSTWLDHHGVRAINEMSAIETCGDKYLTSLALSRAQIPTPRTLVALGGSAALAAIEEIGYPVVLKPAIGSWGRLCVRLRDPESAQAILEHREALPNPQHHVYYLQEYLAETARDLRVIVVGEDVLGAICRIGTEWRCNAARGARGASFRVSNDIQALAIAAARATGGEIVGVDVLEGRDGSHHVLEVNHSVEFREFEAATDIDVAEAIVDYALKASTGQLEVAA